MNHKGILKRSWQILWNYKALWIFGFILAISTASGGSSNTASSSSNSSSSYSSPSNEQPPMLGESWDEGWEEFTQEFEPLFKEVIPAEIVTAAITLAVLLGCVIFILIIITMVFRYMSETALIQMVDRYEETDEKVRIRDGFRLGFSRTAWKVFLVDLVINLPLFIIGITIVALVMLPLLLLLTDSPIASILGAVTAIGLFFLALFVGFFVFAVVSLFKHFFRRAVAIEGLGIFEGIRSGFQLVRKNLVNVGLMWLITAGINIVFTIVLIPTAILIFIISGLLGGAIGLAIGGLMSLVSQGALPIVVGVMAGLPIFIILMVIPLGFLDGLRETYMSSVWTLTYREARALESLELEELNLEIEADESPSE